MKKLAFVFSFLFVGFVFLPVHAEENSVEEPKKNKVLEAADEFVKDLNERDQRHFTVLYGNYNLIRVVEVVRDDVDMAVEACGEANAELKEPLKARFDEWKAAIKPIMEEADANVNNMILAQEYAKPRKIRKFFKLVDKTRKEKNKDVKKVPVTSEEACQTLLKNMDKTQPNMVKLLKTTLVSLPMMMRAEDEKVRAAEEKVAQEAAEKAEAEKKAAEVAAAEKEAAAKAKSEEKAEDSE